MNDMTTPCTDTAVSNHSQTGSIILGYLDHLLRPVLMELVKKNLSICFTRSKDNVSVQFTSQNDCKY